MDEKENRGPASGAGQGIFASMGGKLDRLLAKMQGKFDEAATRENVDRLNSNLRNAGGNVQESLSRAADRAGEIWKDSRAAAQARLEAWRKEHEGEIRDFATKADGWVRDQKGNMRGTMDKLLDKIQKRLKKP